MNYTAQTQEPDYKTCNDYLLSIIVPVYNVERYIRPCLESIFRQGLDENDFEIIIVNDGTPDKSMEMIADIIASHQNIHVINQENYSLSVARNNGIAAAKGEYILMPDSDDLLIENSLKPLLDKALETKADLVVADFLEMTDEEIAKNLTIEQPPLTVKERKGEELYLQDLNPGQCYVWRTLYKRSFLNENHITFVPGITCQDIPYTHECYLKSKNTLRISILLNIYRRGHKSATSNFNKKKCMDLCAAVAATWKLRNVEGLSPKTKLKLNDNIFVSFTLISYVMIWGECSKSDRREIFSYLNLLIPDLSFSHGIKQKVTTFLYKLSPELYYTFRKCLKGFTPSPYGRN